METTNLDYSVNKLCISYAGISDDDGSQVYTDDEEDASINPTLKYSSIKAIPKETVTKKPESISDDDDSQLYTEDEEDTSINPTLKYSSIKPIPKETVIKKPESSESESKSSESEADDAEMKDPFKFGDKDPFKKSRSNEISCEQFITPCSTLPTIPITEVTSIF
uniref:Uncharacterized protein n=1 Tax=Panagrolaimus superbus TaxID=310955 RepID=A0A914YJN8_9BILA